MRRVKDPHFWRYARLRVSEFTTIIIYEDAPFEERQASWQESLAAAHQHIKLGQTLQGQGVEILKSAQSLKGDPAALAKLIQQATATIEKGTKIEREAHRELLNLQQFKPREK